MKKVAIFVEGQTEQIFVTKLLYQFYGYGNVEVSERTTRGKNRFIQLKAPKPDYQYYFLIVDVMEDNKVTSDIVENYKNLIKNGYDKILGLRDLYPTKRKDKDKVMDSLSKTFVQNQIDSRICKIFLAIMEIEAWFLADPHLFHAIDASLTPAYILERLQYDLLMDDPENAYEHPTKIIEKIYELAEKSYRKRSKDAYKIADSINYEYLCLDVREQKKIENFFLFVDELEKV